MNAEFDEFVKFKDHRSALSIMSGVLGWVVLGSAHLEHIDADSGIIAAGIFWVISSLFALMYRNSAKSRKADREF